MSSAGSQTADEATDEPGEWQFVRLLLKLGEHTWGGMKTLWSGFYETHGWRAAEFAAARRSALFVQDEDSWREQRSYLDAALAALGPASKLGAAIREEIRLLDDAATPPDLGPTVRHVAAGSPIANKRRNTAWGALVALHDVVAPLEIHAPPPFRGAVRVVLLGGDVHLLVPQQHGVQLRRMGRLQRSPARDHGHGR